VTYTLTWRCDDCIETAEFIHAPAASAHAEQHQCTRPNRLRRAAEHYSEEGRDHLLGDWHVARLLNHVADQLEEHPDRRNDYALSIPTRLVDGIANAFAIEVPF